MREYAATKLSQFKIHKKGQHLGVRYPCDECDFIASQTSYLNVHKEA